MSQIKEVTIGGLPAQKFIGRPIRVKWKDKDQHYSASKCVGVEKGQIVVVVNNGSSQRSERVDPGNCKPWWTRNPDLKEEAERLGLYYDGSVSLGRALDAVTPEKPKHKFPVFDFLGEDRKIETSTESVPEKAPKPESIKEAVASGFVAPLQVCPLPPTTPPMQFDFTENPLPYYDEFRGKTVDELRALVNTYTTQLVNGSLCNEDAKRFKTCVVLKTVLSDLPLVAKASAPSIAPPRKLLKLELPVDDSGECLGDLQEFYKLRKAQQENTGDLVELQSKIEALKVELQVKHATRAQEAEERQVMLELLVEQLERKGVMFQWEASESQTLDTAEGIVRVEEFQRLLASWLGERKTPFTYHILFRDMNIPDTSPRRLIVAQTCKQLNIESKPGRGPGGKTTFIPKPQ